MKRYLKQIRMRMVGILIALISMIFFMFISGELGWGDSRYMTSLMRTYSGIAFFGCFIYLIVCLRRYKRILQNQFLTEEARVKEMDERRRLIYDKSGGILADLWIVSVAIAAWFAAMLATTEIFYTLLVILLVMVCGKAGTFWYYEKKYE